MQIAACTAETAASKDQARLADERAATATAEVDRLTSALANAESTAAANVRRHAAELQQARSEAAAADTARFELERRLESANATLTESTRRLAAAVTKVGPGQILEPLNCTFDGVGNPANDLANLHAFH